MQHANKNVQVIQVNRFRNQFFLMSAMSKVIVGFSAVFNEIMQNMTTICEYTIEKLSSVSSKMSQRFGSSPTSASQYLLHLFTNASNLAICPPPSSIYPRHAGEQYVVLARAVDVRMSSSESVFQVGNVISGCKILVENDSKNTKTSNNTLELKARRRWLY